MLLADVVMFSLRAVVYVALFTIAAATNVHQCPGKTNDNNLSENVQLTPCKKSPCRLKKGNDQYITINFTPEKDISELKNHVEADVFGVLVPFVGVDGVSVCDKIFTEDGKKASCPLKAGEKYTYKDKFHIYQFYPSIRVKVHWSLVNGSNEVICFEVPATITD